MHFWDRSVSEHLQAARSVTLSVRGRSQGLVKALEITPTKVRDR
jgi:hypothetical protein